VCVTGSGMRASESRQDGLEANEMTSGINAGIPAVPPTAVFAGSFRAMAQAQALPNAIESRGPVFAIVGHVLEERLFG
jgi:hypothetical protein